MPWQEPDGGWGDASGRTDLHVSIDTIGRSADRREDFSEVYGDWEILSERTRLTADASAISTAGPAPAGAPAESAPAAPAVARPGEVAAALRQAERDPAGLTDDQAVALLGADDADLDALAALADGLRREVNGDDVTFVVTRNIN